MTKNIVVCCDGTGNQFDVDQTNVLRLHWALEKDTERQVSFYSPGVGTFRPSMAWTRPGQAFHKTLGLALGIGYRETIENAYWFIVENYREGDRIFLFGFSRGAYAARIVAALIQGVGILQPGNRQLVQFALTELEIRRGEDRSTSGISVDFANNSHNVSPPNLSSSWVPGTRFPRCLGHMITCTTSTRRVISPSMWSGTPFPSTNVVHFLLKTCSDIVPTKISKKSGLPESIATSGADTARKKVDSPRLHCSG